MSEDLKVTIYVTIGNSDNKLEQQEWAMFCADTNERVRYHATAVHGEWYSLPNAEYQNAIWCIEMPLLRTRGAKLDLMDIARAFGQDSILWSQAATVEFLTPPERIEVQETAK